MIHIYEDTIDYNTYFEDIYIHDGVNYFYGSTLRGDIYTGEKVLLVLHGIIAIGSIYMGKNSILNISGVVSDGIVHLNEGVYADLYGIIDSLKLNGGIADLNCMLKGSIEE